MHPILEFDSRTTTRHLKMLKAVLAYIPLRDKRMITIYIKFSELMYTIDLCKKPQPFFPGCGYEDCSHEEPSKPDYQHLLQILTELGDEKEKQTFSQFSSMMNAFTMYEAYAPLIKAMMESGEGAEGLLGSMGLNSSMMDMIRNINSGTNDTSSSRDTNDISAPHQDTNSTSAPQGFQTDMLQAMLSPEQQAMFEKFQETI